MPLEATLFCIDNSEWMRNGDYTPTRMEAQQDAVNLLCSAKTQSNPENTVGLMTAAGARLACLYGWNELLRPEVLVTLTSDVGKILSALHAVSLKGAPQLLSAVQVAQLALKHRQNKNQRQRIIMFVGSPLQEDERSLVRLGKRLKKYNVAVDVINFGEQNDNVARLEAFVAAVDSNGNSHLVTIPPGPHILSDILISSPIVAGEDGATPATLARTGPGGAFEFVDANLDPELAMALRISMEEERQRQEREANAASQASGSAPTTAAETPSTANTAPLAQTPVELDEEAMLAQALALSMDQGGTSMPPSTPAAATSATPLAGGGAMAVDTGDDFMDEDAMLARAIAESLREQGATTGASASSAEPAPMPTDAGQLASMLGSLAGVNVDDPLIRQMIEKLSNPDAPSGDNPNDESKGSKQDPGNGGSSGSAPGAGSSGGSGSSS